MAELIVKDALIREIESVSFTEDAKKMKVTSDAEMDGFFKGYVEGMLYFIPTTTEAEIRASAYERFSIEAVRQFIKFDEEHDFISIGVCLDIISKVAEQLKEE